MRNIYEIKSVKSCELLKGLMPYYYIVVFDGRASFSVDFITYNCKGKSILFISPNQFFQWVSPKSVSIDIIIIQNDPYNIRSYKEEIPHHLILFKNIYNQPFILLTEGIFDEISAIIRKMKYYKVEAKNNFADAILNSYLQLMVNLALSTQGASLVNKQSNIQSCQLKDIREFNKILEKHFLNTKEVSFYASLFALSVSAFRKKIKIIFGKPPSKLIQERVALEAKRMLQFTHKPIKEIATTLNFEDEFYFSRYFKREVGISPTRFRKKQMLSTFS